MMPDAVAASSVDTEEVKKFSKLAADWWDPAGPFAPLHKFNPIRLQLIRDVVAEHFGRDPRSLRPFEGLSLLDIGCGGGLLSEPMARLGCQVLGCDASEANVRAATAHASTPSAVQLTYRAASAEELATEKLSFDIVLNMEVVEHVADVPGFLQAAASLVHPRGLMFLATINKTLKSLALAKIAAEYVLRWLPLGTHDWNSFIAPQELQRMLDQSGMHLVRCQGIAFDPLSWVWRLSADVDVNYILVVGRP